MEFLLPLILLVPLILITTRARKQQRQFQELQAQLQPGQAVVTTSGLHGRIDTIDGDVVVLDVADGVQLRWSRAGIGQIVKSTPEGTDVEGEDTSGAPAEYTADEYQPDEYQPDEYQADRAEDDTAGQPGRQRGA